MRWFKVIEVPKGSGDAAIIYIEAMSGDEAIRIVTQGRVSGDGKRIKAHRVLAIEQRMIDEQRPCYVHFYKDMTEELCQE
jgi:hypothetical protein